MTEKKKGGVVLFQRGGPDSAKAVEAFLYNLFCDPDIIPLGPLGVVLRKPLARYIAHRRVQAVRHHYDEIGGHSPIRLLTERQARALEAMLRPRIEPRVVVAMRYWHPLTAEAAAQLEAAPLDELVLLPLYPHYSFATTASSLKEWRRVYRPAKPPLLQSAEILPFLRASDGSFRALSPLRTPTWIHRGSPTRQTTFDRQGIRFWNIRP